MYDYIFQLDRSIYLKMPIGGKSPFNWRNNNVSKPYFTFFEISFF